MNTPETSTPEPQQTAAPATSSLPAYVSPTPSMPFAIGYPIAAGALSGLILRLIFSGTAGSVWSAMATGFVWFAPFAVGAITVYAAERKKRRHFSYYFWAPMLSTAMFIAGSLMILIEGWICAVVIFPLFALVGMAGGVVMGVICRLTNWPKPAVYSFAVLPLLIALSGPQHREAQIGTIERSVLIAAPAAEIWQHIHHAKHIQAAEVQHAWAYRIGVPLPISGVTVQTPQGPVRKSTWDKGIHFDEVIVQSEPERHVRWTYRFAADSFPDGALDDHVRIGGTYFDLLDTAYTLIPEGNSTRLHLRISYRLSTDFDSYANWVAEKLLGNFSEVILGMYKARSEPIAPHRPEESWALSTEKIH